MQKPTSKMRVSIGLPVFNGEDYLQEAVDSILGQTFEEFELIICDNASTDRTQEICEAYAMSDARVRYYRNAENIGAIQNWYRTFDLSACEYFASAADDDVYHPEFLRKCVAVLDRDPSVVLCYSKTKVIDENGIEVGAYDVEIDTSSPEPHERLYNMIGVDLLCIQMYGVMRASALKQTKVYMGYYGCDRNTLAELSLLGKIYEIPEYLFLHRLYQEALGVALGSGKSEQELMFLDPGTKWHARADFIKLRNYFGAVARTPISNTERLKCYAQLTRLMVEKPVNRVKKRLGATS
jgi:glycosyltransferase involved in cell wall biosynthesis